MQTVISIAQQHFVEIVWSAIYVIAFLVTLVLAGKAIDRIEDWRAIREPRDTPERRRQLNAVVVPFEPRSVR